MVYRKEVAFINRQNELTHLRGYIADSPESILFLHGPKSSGKTTLLYHFIDRAAKEEKLDIKFINLREILLTNYKDFLQVFFQTDYGRAKGRYQRKTRI